MDLDTLIYIIVMIIFIALGAFGKKKKPVNQMDEPLEDGDDEIMSPEEIIAQKLKAFLGDYERKENIPAEPESRPDDYSVAQESKYYSPEPYQKPIEKYITPEPVYEEVIDQVKITGNAIEEGLPAFEHFNFDDDHELSDGDLTQQEDPHLKDSKEHWITGELAAGLDGRKAIIYSEIINRKQF